MNTLLLLAATQLALASSDPYVRTKTSTDSGAHCLWWGEASITFAQNVVGNPVTGASAFAAVTDGFLTWNDQMKRCGNAELVEGPRTMLRRTGLASSGANTNVVLFRYSTCTKKVPPTAGCWAAGTCGNDFDCWDHPSALLGLTTVSYNTASGRIIDADIEFDAADNVFTTISSPPCDAKLAQSCVASDVQNTVTHEIGHFLGLDHTTAEHSTMNATASMGETSKRLIDTGTASFVCEVYPQGQPTRDCTDVATDGPPATPVPAHGCSTSGAASTLALALLLLRRRRAALAPLVLVAGLSQGATLLRLDVAGLSAGSDTIARAKVRSLHTRWSADHAKLLTEVELERVEVWKGALQPTFLVTQPGGELDGVGQRVEGLARFVVGEEVVVFLEARGDRFVVAGAEQGKFRVDRSAAGAVATQGTPAASYVDQALQPVAPQPVSLPLNTLKTQVLGALQAPQGVLLRRWFIE